MQRDAEMLAATLCELGHAVTLTHYHKSWDYARHDVNVYLEVMDDGGAWLDYAGENWLVPNPEWWGGGWDCYLPKFSRVLLKTRDGYRRWCAKVGEAKCTLIGWESLDLYEPDVKRKRVFLHICGKSETKNTAAVIEAWRRYNLQHPLIVSAFKENIAGLAKNVPNVTWVERFSEEELRVKMNECWFHLMPSKYEGYGHAIHEALSCKGVVITTDAPPMNEFAGVHKPLCIAVESAEPRRTAQFFNVSVASLANAVTRAMAMSDEELWLVGENARAGYLDERAAFRAKIAEVVNG